MRSQYLGFFFTVSLGVGAIAGSRLADGGTNSAGSLAMVIALVGGLEVVGALLEFAVVRIGWVLGHYIVQVWDIADELAHENPPTWWKHVPATPGPAFAGRLLTTHGSATFVLTAWLVIAPLVISGLVVQAGRLPGPGAWPAGVSVAVLLVSYGVTIATLLGVRSAQRSSPVSAAA